MTELENTDVMGRRSFSVGKTTEHCTLAVLCVIRDELIKLNNLLGCRNFIEIPKTLRSIRRNTAKKRPKRKAAKP